MLLLYKYLFVLTSLKCKRCTYVCVLSIFTIPALQFQDLGVNSMDNTFLCTGKNRSDSFTVRFSVLYLYIVTSCVKLTQTHGFNSTRHSKELVILQQFDEIGMHLNFKLI